MKSWWAYSKYKPNIKSPGNSDLKSTDLSGCVTETFVFNFALLFVHGKPMEIHATCDVIIHPGWISVKMQSKSELCILVWPSQ